MSAIVSLAELEACLQRKPWQSRSQLEEELGGDVTFPLDQGLSSGRIIERERNEKIEYSVSE